MDNKNDIEILGIKLSDIKDIKDVLALLYSIQAEIENLHKEIKEKNKDFKELQIKIQYETEKLIKTQKTINKNLEKEINKEIDNAIKKSVNKYTSDKYKVILENSYMFVVLAIFILLIGGFIGYKTNEFISNKNKTPHLEGVYIKPDKIYIERKKMQKAIQNRDYIIIKLK